MNLLLNKTKNPRQLIIKEANLSTKETFLMNMNNYFYLCSNVNNNLFIS